MTKQLQIGRYVYRALKRVDDGLYDIIRTELDATSTSSFYYKHGLTAKEVTDTFKALQYGK